MLEPEIRKTYLGELQPPEGYELDRAIATTYSLDLLSLLMAPFSMVFSVEKNWDEIEKDPIALLQSLKEVKDRFVVFCQQGRISAPARQNPLFSYLEESVVEVQPENPNGVMHAKTWLIRYISKDKPVIYRFLCLSKNMTFDHSWDTIVSLEGELKESRKRAYAANHPMAEFFEYLPKLAVSHISESAKQNVKLMSEEVRRVKFDIPEEFDMEDDMPLGIPSKPPKIDWENASRILVMSPFLSEKPILNNLIDYGSDNVLISRLESLDELPEDFVKALQKNCKIYIMNPDAEKPMDSHNDEKPEEISGIDLSGLHAKLIIIEKGRDAYIYSGSANATQSAWSGQNIEFMCMLEGKKSRVGIENFLAKDRKISFYSMLSEYQRPQKPVDNKLKKKLEQLLEQAQKAIINAGIKARVTQSGDGYIMTISASKPLSLNEKEITGFCLPISINSLSRKELTGLIQTGELVFSNLSETSLTSFFAFQLEAKLKGEKSTLSFVLNLPVDGMPQDRDQKIFQSIISDREKFLRLLRLLLAEDKDLCAISNALEDSSGDSASNKQSSQLAYFSQNLMEELVRAYSRNPDKLDRVAQMVEELKRTEDGRKVLPEGFEQIWQVIWETRCKEKGEQK